eukprot:6635104-Pyramimonas_sp.AAC.1
MSQRFSLPEQRRADHVSMVTIPKALLPRPRSDRVDSGNRASLKHHMRLWSFSPMAHNTA